MITSLQKAVTAPVAATHDVLAERLQSVSDVAFYLCKRAKKKLGQQHEEYCRHCGLKDIVEEQAKLYIQGIKDIKHLHQTKKTQTPADRI